MDKVKIGIVGAGAIAEYAHTMAYAKLDNVEMVAISDVNKERAQRLADMHGIPNVYENENDLFSRDDIDAVSICTPNHLHAKQTIAALKAGMHVLVEKPIARSLEEAEEMIKVSKEMDRIIMVGFTHRFFDHNKYVKQQIEEGVIGRPLSFRVRFAHNGPYESWGAKTSWFFDKELAGGGALLDMGIHAIDLLRYFGGEFKAVQGNVGTLRHDIELEDYAGALIDFESGAKGQLEIGWYSIPEFSGYEINGTEGAITSDYSKVRICRIINGEEEWLERKAGSGGWDKEIESFVKIITGDGASQCTAEEGKIALEWALKMY